MHKIFLLLGGAYCAVVFSAVEGQLDLPSMPGPPYPDPRGQNRWGVKFDPRKHGPPFDQRGRGCGAFPRHRRPPPSFHEDGDSRVSPAIQSFKKHRNHRHGHSQSNPFYGNELHSKTRPNYNQYYGAEAGRNLNSNGQDEFWNAWNSQYKKKPELYKSNAGEAAKPQKEVESGPNKYWKMLKSMWTGNQGGKDSEKGNLAGDSSAFGYQIDIAFPRKPAHHLGGRHRKPKQEQSWKVFTTIGRGLDAVHGGVRHVRKAVLGTSGSVLATGAKLGGKVAVYGAKKVAHVGASILANKMLEKAVATAIATAG